MEVTVCNYIIDQSCAVEQKDVDSGTTTYWSGNELESCANFAFQPNQQMTVYVQTGKMDNFCPVYVSLELSNEQGRIRKYCAKMELSQFFGQHTNGRSHLAKEEYC